MPKYSGDQIYQGGIENGRVTATALNYRRTAASSNFGTRKLAFYSLHIEQDFGLAANWQDSNSLYYQMVRAIQQGGVAVGGIDAPTEGNGDIRGGGGGGAELFYVGEPQNSAASPLNQASGWYNFKPQNDSGHIYVARATGDGTIAKLEFVEQPTPPFNVGDPVRVADVGNGYNCNLYDQHFVTECTTTYVKFNSTATTTVYDGGTSIGYVYVDLGYDCFTFAVADDAEPFLPEGNGFFSDVDFSGVAGDSLCYCGGSGRIQGCNYPYNFVQAVAKVLTDNELSTSSLYIWRLNPSFGLTF